MDRGFIQNPGRAQSKGALHQNDWSSSLYKLQFNRSGRWIASFFAMSFGNPKVKVYVEYIVYDFVATISAIGGTMGLCIGFSFTGVASSLFEWAARLQKQVRCWKGSDPKSRLIKRKARPNAQSKLAMKMERHKINMPLQKKRNGEKLRKVKLNKDST